MRKHLCALAALAATLATVTVGCGGARELTPVQVTDIFAWDLDHGDFYGACRQVDLKAAGLKSVGDCVYSLISTSALSLFGGGPALPSYKVVPHSENIQGDKATVKVVISIPGSSSSFDAKLTHTDHGWKISG